GTSVKEVRVEHHKGGLLTRPLLLYRYVWIDAAVPFGPVSGMFKYLLIALIPFCATAAEPLRIICFGAHPDDCELQVGGTAALWASKGHKVKLVSFTNGDIGHWTQAGGPLARRRYDEGQNAARNLGVTTEVMDIHDGELMPTVENRRMVTRLIREWKA